MWQRLYFRPGAPSAPIDAHSLAEALRAALAASGYVRYDPFALMPSLHAYARAVKLFVAPDADSGFLTAIAAPDPVEGEIVASASAALGAEALRLALEPDGSAVVQRWQLGAASAPPAFSAADLERLAPLVAAPAETDAPIVAVPLTALPDDVQAALRSGKGVSAEAANKLFAKMSSAVGGKLDDATAAQADAARALLQQTQIDWNAPGARQIRAVCAALGLASPLNSPDFPTLRDAYHLHTRRRRKPDAPLLPGDAEALAAVPDALAYLPVFAGMRS
jgi:hypothetical protein